MKKLEIIPTLFSKNLKEFKAKLNKVENLSKNLHIDIMDGKFVSSKSVSLNKLEFIKNLKNNFEVHLMCEKPEKYFEICEKLNIKKVYFHFEVFKNLEEVFDFLNYSKKFKFKIGIVINPETKFKEVLPVLKKLNNIMIMSVVPGAQGQKFITNTYQKVKKYHEFDPKLNIQIDGGIKINQIKKLVENGGNSFCVGSFLNSVEDPKDNFKKLENSMRLGKTNIV